MAQEKVIFATIFSWGSQSFDQPSAEIFAVYDFQNAE